MQTLRGRRIGHRNSEESALKIHARSEHGYNLNLSFTFIVVCEVFSNRFPLDTSAQDNNLPRLLSVSCQLSGFKPQRNYFIVLQG